MKNCRKCGTTRIWPALYVMCWRLCAGSDCYSWSHIHTHIHTYNHTYIKITFKSALCLHIREFFLSICYWVLLLIVTAHLVLSTFTSTPVSWLSCCRIYDDILRVLYLYSPILYNSPPESQNHGWCGHSGPPSAQYFPLKSLLQCTIIISIIIIITIIIHC